MYTLHFHPNPYAGTIDVFFRVSTQSGRPAYAEPVAIKVVEYNDVTERSPMLKLQEEDAKPMLQDVMNQLWNLGYRPSDVGTAGHLAATQAHLADMKALVEKSYKVKLPS